MHAGNHPLFRFARPMAGLWLALTLFGAACFLLRFDLNNSVGVWFPKHDPALTEYERFLDTFGPWEWSLLLLESDTAPDPALLAEVGALAESLAVMPSIRQVVDARGFSTPSGASAAPVSGPPWVLPLLLETANDIHRGDDFRREMLAAIDRRVAGCPGIRSHTVVGTSVINVGLNRSARRDMMLFFGLVFVLLAGVSRVMLRSWRDTAVLLATASAPVTVTLGLLAGSGRSFNILTIMMPTVLIALSVANLVHLVHVFHRHRRIRPCRPHEAALRAVREVRLPALGTTLTTVIGFLSLAPSDMPPVRQLALFSAGGIALAWLGTLTLAPVLLTLVWRGRADSPPPPRLRLTVLDAWARRIPGLGRGPVLALVATAPLLAGLSLLHTDTNYVKFFRPGSQVRRAYERSRAANLAQTELDLVVRAPRPLDPGVLIPYLDAVRRVPEVRVLLAPQFLPALTHFSSPDGRAMRATVFTDFLGNDATGDLARRLDALGAQLLPPEASVEVTGSPFLWERMDASISRTQRGSIVLVAVGTLLLLMALFRNPVLALVGWLASALPVAWILGLMGLLGVPVTLATVLIAGIALGLAVDDTVHFVLAYRRRTAAGADRRRAVTDTLAALGERMIATSVILSVSFGVMTFSDFTPTANFGSFTALTILLALAADLCLVPWALALERPVGRRRAPSAESNTPVRRSI
jgi:predicted RND superfamily exporter protein